METGDPWKPIRAANRYEVAINDGAVTLSKPKYKDRIYAVWSDTRFGNSRLLISYSIDRGNTWTEPKQLSPGVPASSAQFQPAVSVNKNGVLGVEWLDTRNAPAGDSFDVYFTGPLMEASV